MTSSPPPAETDPRSSAESPLRRVVSRITRLELVVGGGVAALMLLLLALEPSIVEAPFQNGRTLLFTAGGTAIAAAVFVTMLWINVPARARIVVLLVPFAAVNWWLLSPYFIDDVVNEEFATSIDAQLAGGEPGDAVAVDMPELLGAGTFVGLTGHTGIGDAGIFENPDGTLVLRFENFETDNGPDLDVYLVPGADQTDLVEGSINLGTLKGNIGDQTYELPPGTELSGPYTVLVWCTAFSVEFTGATIQL
ncbi:MAG: DM13 domain-containing protein [Actinomycetota bacterium]